MATSVRSTLTHLATGILAMSLLDSSSYLPINSKKKNPITIGCNRIDQIMRLPIFSLNTSGASHKLVPPGWIQRHQIKCARKIFLLLQLIDIDIEKSASRRNQKTLIIYFMYNRRWWIVPAVECVQLRILHRFPFTEKPFQPFIWPARLFIGCSSEKKLFFTAHFQKLSCFFFEPLNLQTNVETIVSNALNGKWFDACRILPKHIHSDVHALLDRHFFLKFCAVSSSARCHCWQFLVDMEHSSQINPFEFCILAQLHRHVMHPDRSDLCNFRVKLMCNFREKISNSSQNVNKK